MTDELKEFLIEIKDAFRDCIGCEQNVIRIENRSGDMIAKIDDYLAGLRSFSPSYNKVLDLYEEGSASYKKNKEFLPKFYQFYDSLTYLSLEELRQLKNYLTPISIDEEFHHDCFHAVDHGIKERTLGKGYLEKYFRVESGHILIGNRLADENPTNQERLLHESEMTREEFEKLYPSFDEG